MIVDTFLFKVFEGQEVVVIEAMKLQNSLAMAKTGIVSIHLVYSLIEIIVRLN